MAARDAIIYLRVTDTESFPVDADNNILVTNKFPTIYYSEYPTIKIRPLKADGTPYSLADYSYDSWVFGIDNDWDRSTTPIMLQQSSTTTFTVEEVTVGDITYVQIAFGLDAYKEEFETAIGTDKELRLNVYAELAAYSTGISQAQSIMQFPFILRNKLIDISASGLPSGQESQYRTRSEEDATFETIIKSDPKTITDDTANYIYLGSTSVYRSVSFEGIIQDTSNNYNMVSGYVTHDGTNATSYVEQDDMGGTMIGTLTYSADISSANIRLIITAASVGENLTFTYGLKNRIADYRYTMLPTDVFGCREWWAPDLITGLNDLDDVTTYIGATGVYSATQSNAAYKPVYRTNQANGLPGILYTAANLEHLITTLAPTAEQTVFVIFKLTSITDSVLIGSTDSSNNTFLGVETTTDKLIGGVATQDGSTIIATTTLSTGTLYVAMLKYNGSNINLALDGIIEYAAAQSGAVSNTQGMYHGALNTDGSPGSYADVTMFDVIVYGNSVSTVNTDRIITFAKNKYNF